MFPYALDKWFGLNGNCAGTGGLVVSMAADTNTISASDRNATD